jgi:hypothetical protein
MTWPDRRLRGAEPGHRYAIGADVATARGRDYSAAYVIDLSTMAAVAEFHGRLDEDLYAAQLHYLGRMYGRDVPPDPKDPEGSRPGFAKLAVETGGGFGNAVIAAFARPHRRTPRLRQPLPPDPRQPRRPADSEAVGVLDERRRRGRRS